MNTYKSLESIVGLKEDVDILLKNNSIIIPENSRFKFYQELLENQHENRAKYLINLCKANNLDTAFLPFIYKEYYDFLYTLSKILVLYESLSDLRDKKALLKKIKIIFKGDSFIEKEHARNSFSEPRDTLFELTVASQFYDIGLNDIQFLEHPDVLVNNQGAKFGFECKRIRYYLNDNFKKRSEDAVDQLGTYKESHNIGIIAIDVSYLVTDGGKMNIDTTLKEFHRRSMQLMKDLCNDLEKKSAKLKNAVEESEVFGIILFSSGVVQLSNEFIVFANNYVRTYDQFHPVASELFDKTFVGNIEKSSNFED